MNVFDNESDLPLRTPSPKVHTIVLHENSFKHEGKEITKILALTRIKSKSVSAEISTNRKDLTTREQQKLSRIETL